MASHFSTVPANSVAAVKLGVGDATPVTTQTHIADVTGGSTTDAEARAAIASILNVLEAFGLTATS